MLMRASMFTVALAIVVAACGANQASSVAIANSPFQRLDGVQLGMRADELRKLRPHLKVKEYVGWWEQVGDTVIEYSFDPELSVEVDGSAKLRRVAAIMTFTSDSAARAQWAAARTAFGEQFKSEPKCERIPMVSVDERLTWLTSSGRYRLSLGVRGVSSTGVDSVTHMSHAFEDPAGDPKTSVLIIEPCQTRD